MAILSARQALTDDLPAIVGLLADDVLSQSREIIGLPLHPDYLDAFQRTGFREPRTWNPGTEDEHAY